LMGKGFAGRPTATLRRLTQGHRFDRVTPRLGVEWGHREAWGRREERDVRVDTQSHLLPEWYLDHLAKRKRSPRVTGRGEGRFIQVGAWRGKFGPKMTSLEGKLRDMDAAGVDVTVLSSQFPGPELLGREGVDLARRLNDFVAGICRKHPDRFVGLCSLPLQDPKAGMAELTRCMKDLDLRGVLLFSNVNGRTLDGEAFAPLFARAEAEGIPLYLHPTYPLIAEHTADYQMIAGIGFMVDTALAAIRLIMSGTLERHPPFRFEPGPRPQPSSIASFFTPADRKRFAAYPRSGAVPRPE